MDDRRFDRIAMLFAAAPSRRTVLGAALGGIVARFADRVRHAHAASERPIPNFPFLPLLPTDPGFERFAVDRVTVGGPTLAIDPTAIPTLAPALRAALSSSFRAGYSASIVQSSETDPSTPSRAVTTLLVDCGDEASARQAFDDYVAVLAGSVGATELTGIKSVGKASRYLGCNGLCESAIGGPYGGGESDGIIAISYRGRMLSDVRVRDLGGLQVAAADARAAAKIIDVRVKATLAASSAVSPIRAFASGEEGDLLAAFNTIPIFSLAGEPAATSTRAFLRVKDGVAIPWAPPLDGSNEVRARETARDGYRHIIHAEQIMTATAKYRDDYLLIAYHEQYDFPTAELRQAYFDAYRANAERDIPGITFTDVDVSETQLMYGFSAPLGDDVGTWNGFETFAMVDSPLGVLMFDVSLVAVPVDPGHAPAPIDVVIAELGDAVFEMQTVIAGCLREPESCPRDYTIVANPITAAS